MEIFRNIWVKDINTIDYQNLGNHWTTHEFLLFNGFTESNELRGKNPDDYIQIWIRAEVSEEQIATSDGWDENCEVFANIGEYEVITKFNTDIEVSIATEDDIIYEGVANTGMRYQETVD